MNHRKFARLTLAAAAMLAATPLLAQLSLVTAKPAANALAAPTNRIDLGFNEKIMPANTRSVLPPLRTLIRPKWELAPELPKPIIAKE